MQRAIAATALAVMSSPRQRGSPDEPRDEHAAFLSPTKTTDYISYDQIGSRSIAAARR
jgi:hypothetical protein